MHIFHILYDHFSVWKSLPSIAAENVDDDGDNTDNTISHEIEIYLLKIYIYLRYHLLVICFICRNKIFVNFQCESVTYDKRYGFIALPFDITFGSVCQRSRLIINTIFNWLYRLYFTVIYWLVHDFPFLEPFDWINNKSTNWNVEKIMQKEMRRDKYIEFQLRMWIYESEHIFHSSVSPFIDGKPKKIVNL